jgi:hypothetical protein
MRLISSRPKLAWAIATVLAVTILAAGCSSAAPARRCATSPGRYAGQHLDAAVAVQPGRRPDPAGLDFLPHLNDVSRRRQLGAKQHLEPEPCRIPAGFRGVGAVPFGNPQRDQLLGPPGFPCHVPVGRQRRFQCVVLRARDPSAWTDVGLLPAVFTEGTVERRPRPGREPGRDRYRQQRHAAARDPAIPALTWRDGC